METLEGRHLSYTSVVCASYFLDVIGKLSRLSKTLIPLPQPLQQQGRHARRELAPILYECCTRIWQKYC